MGANVGQRAVVLGAGMAGLFNARVLSRAYGEVTVVDRDTITGAAEQRRGVPQGRHVHGLQARGQQGIEELFPGFTDEMRRAGAVIGDMCGSTRLYVEGARMVNAHAGLVALAVSRPFLEHQVRLRVAAVPNVTFLEQHDVLGLETTADRRRVTGVRVARRDEGSAEAVLDADLVVDATGRTSRVPGWLGELGYSQAEEERLSIDLGYATRRYRLRSDPFGEGEIELAVICSPATPRGAIAMKVEDDQVIVTAYGMLGDHPPTDPEGFDDFVKSLEVPDVYDAVQDLEPVTDPVPYRFHSNLRRRYERLSKFPDGLLVTGDSVCSFNPAYGQGMTAAVVGALTLDRHLQAGSPPRARAFFRDLAREAIDPPWELMTTADLTFPEVEGRRTLRVRLGQRYLARVGMAMTCDPGVSKAFMRVFGLVDRPVDLLRPRTFYRVLRSSRQVLREANGHVSPAGEDATAKA